MVTWYQECVLVQKAEILIIFFQVTKLLKKLLSMLETMQRLRLNTGINQIYCMIYQETSNFIQSNFIKSSSTITLHKSESINMLCT